MTKLGHSVLLLMIRVQPYHCEFRLSIIAALAANRNNRSDYNPAT
jgi:hypothetical protein